MPKHTRQAQAIRRAVWEGRREKTPGGLRKSDLTMNKAGRIVSKKKSQAAKRGVAYQEIKRRGMALKEARRIMEQRRGKKLGRVLIGKGPEGKELQRIMNQILSGR